VRSTFVDLGADPTQDETSGNIRTVKLVDLDRDGDLDMFLGQAGRFTTSFRGAPDWILTNRTIGDNLLAQTRPPIARQPGTPTIPVVTGLTPPVALPGATLSVEIFGSNFERGSSVDLGPGVTAELYTFIDSSRMRVRLRVASSAHLQPRKITIIDPQGLRHISVNPVFQIVSELPNGVTAATEWNAFE
jgi:hypothetical protein